jgi:fibronectin-binding autotransporter adhesin
MPTLNNDLSAVAPSQNPIDDAAQKRSLRIVGVSLGATLVTVFVLFAAMAMAPEDARAANICTLTSTQPTTNWNDTTKWSGCGGGYPGQSGAGDIAIISLSPTLLNINVPLNPLALQIGSVFPITIASGATLTLQSSSTATTGNSFTVASGGTMGTDTGASITGFQGSVHVNGGTFNSLGSIQFTGGAFTFSGGNLTGSGTINISNAAVFDGALGAMPISATTINTSGILSYTSAANAVTLSSGATINVLSGGGFTFATDAAINGTATEGIKINSGGSMQKTGGTSFNVISCFVKNDGTVDASTGGSGGFGFSGDGAHSGAFITGSSQPIVFAGNNTFGAGTSFSGGSPIKIAAGTQTFNAAITAGSGLKWAGGTIAGTGPLSVSSSMLFDGSISAMTLTGVMKSTAAITYAPSNINNLLTINGAAAVFETTTPGSLAIAGDYDILASPVGAGKLRISGTGNVNKTGGATGSAIYAYVDNQASTIANSASGPLSIAGGGQSTGSVSVPSPGNVINVTGGMFDSSGIFSGNGNVNVTGGTLNVNTATTFSSAPALGISAGTLAGSGAITLTGPMTWSGGTISGSSSFTISPATGVLTLTGANGVMTLNGRTITNNSSLLYNSSANNLQLWNGASIVNGGTFTASGSGTIATDGSATSITNNGTFNKTLSGLFIIAPAFNNAGSGISITGGVLDVDATGISSAPWTMSAGTEVWFPTPFAGTYTFASGTTFAGGKVTIDGSGTVATSFPMTINNTNLEVNGGTFSTPSTFTVTAPGTLKWKGGTLTGSGHTVISSGTTFDMTSESSPRSVSGHTIDNGGNATLSATSQPPSLDSGSTFNNTGTLDIRSDGSMNTNGVAANSFSNSGTVKKSVGGSGFRFDVPYNQTAGTTDANSATSGSTIIFNAGGSLSGGTLKATQSTNFVDFFNASFNVSGGSFSGPGAIRLKGGILNINTPFAFPSLFNETAGSLGGTSAITIPNAAVFNWSGGSITGSAGVPITIQSGGALNADTTTSSLIYDTRPLVINSGGNVNWNSGANAIIFQSGSPVSDSGTFSVGTANGTLGNATAGSFSVSGLFRHTGAGTLNVTLPMSVQSGGTIESSGGSTLALLSTVGGTHAGTFDAQSGSFIDFSAGTHQFNAGAGFSAGTGVYKVLGAFVSLGTNVSAPNVALVSGSIAGTGDLTTSSTAPWC